MAQAVSQTQFHPRTLIRNINPVIDEPVEEGSITTLQSLAEVRCSQIDI